MALGSFERSFLVRRIPIEILEAWGVEEVERLNSGTRFHFQGCLANFAQSNLAAFSAFDSACIVNLAWNAPRQVKLA